MKAARFILVNACCLLLGFSHATSFRPITVQRHTTADLNNSVNELIRSSFRSGSAQSLAEYFDKQLELLIDAEAVDFPEVRAKHAELILNTFFKKYPPQNFHFVYQGGSANLRYITGLYHTGGQRFSVYMLMRQDANHRLVINALHLLKG